MLILLRPPCGLVLANDTTTPHPTGGPAPAASSASAAPTRAAAGTTTVLGRSVNVVAGALGTLLGSPGSVRQLPDMLTLRALELSHGHYLHGAALDAESLALAQCLGHLMTCRFDHPPERLAGDVHLSGSLFLIHAL